MWMVENMPKMPENVPNTVENTLESSKLRPYTAHHIDLEERGSQAIGDCPFCGREGKFTAHVDTGLWRCFVCDGSGNPLTFIRLLWDRSDAATTNDQARVLAEERRLLDLATLGTWGCCVSLVDGKWLLAGYDTAQPPKLHQLYRRTNLLKDGRRVPTLLPTPGVWPDGKSHGLHMPSMSFDPRKPAVDVFEGPWDGMAWWEVARQCKWQDGKLVLTGNEAQSIVGSTNAVAVPGCNTFRQEWVAICRNKDVTLWYDSDHPRPPHGARAGWGAMKRIAVMLKGVARSIKLLRWGPDGYDPALKDGFDVRDCVTARPTLKERIALLEELYKLVTPPPEEWLSPNGTKKVNGTGGHVIKRSQSGGIEPERCESWSELEARWTDAHHWRQDMGDVLQVMCGISGSTQQAGNQLYVQVIGDAGSGKSSFCDGLLVSKNCHAVRHVTSFHSGWKKTDKDSGEDVDCSLVARINGKTLVTPEGDVIASSPKFMELMSQQRQMFDGTTGNTYGNDDKDRNYAGLRCPWIMAGTPALMDIDQSRLGDRFLRVIIRTPDDEMKRLILRSALRSERVAVLGTADGTAHSIVEPKLCKAQAMTGGYVDWLRANIAGLLPAVHLSTEAEDRILDLSEFTADLRARPNYDIRKHEPHEAKELPTRIARQLCRLALCLSVVLGKREVDGEVLRVTTKVAFDTSHGRTLDLVRFFMWLHPRRRCSDGYRVTCQDSGGLMSGELSGYMNMPEEKLVGYLNFLKKINVVRFMGTPGTHGVWKLTERVVNLYNNVTN